MIVLMLFRFSQSHYDADMKRLFGAFLIIITAVLGGSCYATLSPVEGSSNYVDNGMGPGDSTDCVDLEFVFARGSGAEYEKSDMWLKYQSEMKKLAERLGYSYRITDVEYPAVSVIDPISNAIGAYVSAGQYYEFGRSVKAGVSSLREYYDGVARVCPESRWVLAGYSQGSMVVSEAVKKFKHDKVVYIALFTDPQLYLPEGKGLFPDACMGRNMSEYRVYVPVCRTHEGRLKARNPYVYGELVGKYGLWCGPDDYVCGSTQIPWNLSGHTKYVDKIPQLTAILRKRLARGGDVANRSVGMRSKSADDEPNVFAEFTLNTYYGHPGDTITVDASPSFSLDADIIDYQWSIDDEEFWSSGSEPRISVSYDEKSNHTVRVRVTDFLYESGEAEAEIDVMDGDISDDELDAPVGVSTRADGEDVVLAWNDPPTPAKYLFVRLNGYDLGYVESSRKELIIKDVDLNEKDVVLSVGWATEDMNLGKFTDLALPEANNDVNGEAEPPIEAPDTGVSLAEGLVSCLVLLGCLTMIRKILWA